MRLGGRCALGLLAGEFGFEVVEFGAGHLALEYFDHFFKDVTFRDVFADANGAGSEAVGTQLLGEPKFGHLLAFAGIDEA